MNSDDGHPFSNFDVKTEHSLILNHHSTPPSTLHRAALDALQTPGIPAIPDRCFGTPLRALCNHLSSWARLRVLCYHLSHWSRARPPHALCDVVLPTDPARFLVWLPL